jgi:hypothetical protein
VRLDESVGMLLGVVNPWMVRIKLLGISDVLLDEIVKKY